MRVIRSLRNKGVPEKNGHGRPDLLTGMPKLSDCIAHTMWVICEFSHW